jgi:GNAT superfamily N-acetyltransferase
MPSIDMLPTGAAGDADVVARLTDLVNRVYAVAEAGLWVEGAARTTAAEMAGLIAAGEIAVARHDRHDGHGVHGEQEGHDGHDGAIVGSVRIQRIDDGLGEFGMLVADPTRRGAGIGRDLVAFAEDWCRGQGHAVMQLELLVPRDWTHPEKEFLDAWYTRIGYRPVRTGGFEESYPHLAPLLATPCDFVIYHKPLAVGASA